MPWNENFLAGVHRRVIFLAKIILSETTQITHSDDPHNLDRFVRAQEDDYEQALAEIKSGRKKSHWMWYIFPQLDGLAFSSTSRLYSIKNLEEAQAYVAHPILGPRLAACTQAVLEIEGRSAQEIFGFTDALKLRSCATLFAQVTARDSVFQQLLDKYFDGLADTKTIELLKTAFEAKRLPEAGSG